jgi:hypothetical protein
MATGAVSGWGIRWEPQCSRRISGVHELLVLDPTAPARLGHLIGHTGHVLHASGQHDIGHAGLDHGHARDHRLHAGDADAVDGGRCNRIGNTGQQGGHSSDVECIGRFHAAAKSNIVNHGRIDPGTRNCRLHDAAADAGRMGISQTTAKCTDSRTTGGNDNHFFHSFSLVE